MPPATKMTNWMRKRIEKELRDQVKKLGQNLVKSGNIQKSSNTMKNTKKNSKKSEKLPKLDKIGIELEKKKQLKKYNIWKMNKEVFVEETSIIWDNMHLPREEFAKKFCAPDILKDMRSIKNGYENFLKFIDHFKSFYSNVGKLLKKYKSVKRTMKATMRRGDCLGFNSFVFREHFNSPIFYPTVGQSMTKHRLNIHDLLRKVLDNCPEKWRIYQKKLDEKEFKCLISGFLCIIVQAVVGTVRKKVKYEIDENGVFTGISAISTKSKLKNKIKKNPQPDCVETSSQNQQVCSSYSEYKYDLGSNSWRQNGIKLQDVKLEPESFSINSTTTMPKLKKKSKKLKKKPINKNCVEPQAFIEESSENVSSLSEIRQVPDRDLETQAQNSVLVGEVTNSNGIVKKTRKRKVSKFQGLWKDVKKCKSIDEDWKKTFFQLYKTNLDLKLNLRKLGNSEE